MGGFLLLSVKKINLGTKITVCKRLLRFQKFFGFAAVRLAED